MLSATVIVPIRTNAVATLRPSRSSRLAPYCREKTVPLPIASPSNTDVRNVISV
ncbi:unknown [Prevotella sp. CAG:755]|nr:unknown [Prevotella sp. CAG:755]